MFKEDIDHVVDFIDTYYRDEVAKLAQRYPNDQQNFWISHNDVWRFDEDLAERLLVEPDEHKEWFAEAIDAYDIPVDYDLSDVIIRVNDLPPERNRSITDLRSDDTGEFLAVEGTLEQVTKAKEVPLVLSYECKQCGSLTPIPQNDPNDIQEPYECSGCGKNGPFVVDHDDSKFVDEVKANLKQPPDEAPSGQGESLTVIVREDLLEIDGKHIQTFVGERVMVNGMIERRRESNNSREFIRYLHADSFDFPNQKEDIDVANHIDEIEAEASRDDCIERFAGSLVPQLYETDVWNTGLLVAVAYLFGSPRIDLRNNDSIEADATFRGDIHVGFIGDPGTMKSGVARAIHQFSPQSEHRSATGLSSEVGLTASAVQDQDFEGGKWTLKPGILVRANGGHVIIEEIDKTKAELNRMNDGLEGDQQITVDKAGISATLETRVGLLVTANPEEGRFDSSLDTWAQIDIDRSLISRFDAILTIRDTPDVDVDSEIAGQIGGSYKEAAEAEFGGRTEFDSLDRHITPDLGRAWIQYARENIHPIPTREAIEMLQEWYAEDARQLNDDSDTIPATPRKMEVGLRFASAFARVRLSEELTVRDAQKAIEVQKALIGETYDPETNTFNADMHNEAGVVEHKPETQKEKIDAIYQIVKDEQPGGLDAMPLSKIQDHAKERGIDEDQTEHYVRKMTEEQQGGLYEPTTNAFKVE